MPIGVRTPPTYGFAANLVEGLRMVRDALAFASGLIGGNEDGR